MVGEIGRKRGWIHANLRNNLKRIGRWIKIRKIAILVVIVWSISVASVMVRSYLFVQKQEPSLLRVDISGLNEVDYLLIFAMGLISGAILVDLERAFYGWIASTFLSCSIAFIFSLFFIWFWLGTGEIYSSALGWARAVEIVSSVVVRNVFRMMFPFALVFSLFAVFGGSFLRVIIQPSAEA